MYFKRNSLKNHNFTQKQLEVIAGTMLGDGSLSITSGNNNSRLANSHSLKQQRWLSWKHEKLFPFSREIIQDSSIGRKKIGNIIINDHEKQYEKKYFYTVKHPTLTNLEKIWYKRDEKGNYIYKIINKKKYRIKIIPVDLILTPLMLAVWAIDDGYNNQSQKKYTLHTESFTDIEVENLVGKIKKIGIKDCFKSSSAAGFVIDIRKFSYLDFIRLIKIQIPDIPIDVRYKIDTTNYKIIAKRNLPFFYNIKNFWRGKIIVNGEKFFLGQYAEENTAKMVSQEVEKLLEMRCKDKQKFIDVRLKYKNARNILNFRNNSSGIAYFKYVEDCGRWEGKTIVNKKVLYLGRYKDINIAIRISEEVKKLKKLGCMNYNSYIYLKIKIIKEFNYDRI
jgi:hypothetical protein